MVCGTYISLRSRQRFFHRYQALYKDADGRGRVFEVGDEKLLELAHKTQSTLSTSILLHSALIDW